jgi:hypothetical protein
MKETLQKIAYYILLPSIILAGLISILYYQLCDFEKSVNISATIAQTMAIFIGGLWAYHKFDWGKRAESAIKIKAMLMRYEQLHNEAAMQYRLDQRDKKDWFECWTNYAMKMIPAYNEFSTNVHLSCYIPKKVRDRLFKVVFLSLNNGKSPETDDLDTNWKTFGLELKKIKKELDDLVRK